MPRCKNCRNKFEPIRFNQKYCLESECVRVWVAIEKEKAWKKTKAVKKAELMSLSDHLKLTQAIVNKWIRLRDKDELCISCGKHINGVEHASHYLSSGGHSNLRFHEDNIWKSCYKCNVMLSSNAIEYRKRLIKKIGIEKVEWLEENGSIVKRWTIEELKEIIETYKQKIKEHEGRR
jgi:MinD superfamily P-loop ATPase